MWLKDPRCEEVVQEACYKGLTENSNYVLGKCLDRCRTRMEAQNKAEFGHVGRTVTELQKHLEWLELQPSSPVIIQDMKNTRIEVSCWLEKEDAILLQRSRINWLQSEDRNTRFFHTKSFACYNKNFIVGLMDSEEVWQEDETRVEEIVVGYYQNPFSSSNPSDLEELIQAVQPNFTPAMKH